MNHISTITYAVILLLFPVSSFACTQFPRNLSVGSSGEDVRELQKYLNTNGFPVSLSGPGSPGLETTYFGQATKRAVGEFQKTHAQTVLLPLGISTPTGYFGEKSRMFVQQVLCEKKEDTQATNNTVSWIRDEIARIQEEVSNRAKTELLPPVFSPAPSVVTTPTVQNRKPVLRSISPTQGNIGTRIRITGEYFSPDENEILTTVKRYENVSSYNGGTELEIVLDADQNMRTKEGVLPNELPFFIVVGVDGQYSNVLQLTLQ
jgi:peptidoglycan hydrolase-like protein with peptidoglycan-binding domain